MEKKQEKMDLVPLIMETAGTAPQIFFADMPTLAAYVLIILLIAKVTGDLLLQLAFGLICIGQFFSFLEGWFFNKRYKYLKHNMGKLKVAVNKDIDKFNEAMY